VDIRAGLNTVMRRKITSPHQESNPSHPACRLVTVLKKLQEVNSYAPLTDFYTVSLNLNA
jgi:hypothetical protein